MSAALRFVLIIALASLPLAARAADEYCRALEAYERSHYVEAMRLLEQAAERNDVTTKRAAEMLGLMYWYGSGLYGDKVPRNEEQARRWLQRAAAAGSDVAGHMLMRMGQRAPGGEDRRANR